MIAYVCVCIKNHQLLKDPPTWQMLIFSYNEKNIEKCIEMAKQNDIPIMISQSSRWFGDEDVYKPKNKEYLNAFFS